MNVQQAAITVSALVCAFAAVAQAQAPIATTGTTFQKTLTSSNGGYRACFFDQFGGKISEVIVLKLDGRPAPMTFTGTIGFRFNAPSNYYEILGEVYRLRNTYASMAVDSQLATRTYTIHYRDNNSQGSSLDYTLASEGGTVGKIDSPRTDRLVKIIDRYCPF